MRLEQLYYFEKIYEEKSMSKAAEKLFVSPPAMSIAVANLEKELGMQLFIRQRKGIEITQKGEEIIGPVREILRNIEIISDVAQENVKSELRILSMPVLSAVLLPQILGAWKRKNADINVWMEEEGIYSILDKIMQNSIHDKAYISLCALTSEELQHLEPQIKEGRTVCIALGKDRTYCYADKSIFPNQTSVTMEECKSKLMIFYGKNIEEMDDIAVLRKIALEKGKNKKGFQKENNYMSVSNIILLKQMIRDKLGIALMPGLLFCDEEIDADRDIRMLEIEDMENEDIDYYLLYSGQRELKKKKKEFIQDVQIFFAEWQKKQR